MDGCRALSELDGGRGPTDRPPLAGSVQWLALDGAAGRGLADDAR